MSEIKATKQIGEVLLRICDSWIIMNGMTDMTMILAV